MSLPLRTSNRTKKPMQNESTGIDKTTVLEFKKFINDKSETTSKKMLKQKKLIFVEPPKDIQNNVENNEIFQLQEKIYNETITEDDMKKLKQQEEENKMLKKRVAQLEYMLKKNKAVPTMIIPLLNPTPTNLVSPTWLFSGAPSLFPQQWKYLPILPIPSLFNQQWTGGYSGLGINNPELIPFVDNPPNAYYNAQFHHRFF
ncbi:hypothetical protein HCN44_003364 [Aphidius gifuensis]|uniref:Uncharacterized protein n=1 Tax=Aphidius gifuensis TaxID=684658 RepID=A0A835CRT9_APHGI|nr:hypothetical protein HCN44_003364 [Aphidius gifuensis]